MKYKNGNWVEHPKRDGWGRGYVLEVICEEKIRVFFEKAGVKEFSLKPLKHITLKKLHPDNHISCEWLNQLKRYGAFPWPTTNAPIGKHGLGDVFFYKDGLLSYVGYRVGNEGEPMQVRRDLLDWVFHNRLPRVKFESYMREWGEPKTPARLQKMANVLATLTRNVKRNISVNYSATIRDRESDLKYLYDAYYVGRFDFNWPPSHD